MPFITSRASGGFGCVYSTSSTTAASIPITYLMVAGGGGGGAIRGAGAGAGGLLYSTLSLEVGVMYNIIVGTGGTGGIVSPAAAGSGGNNTVFNSLTAIGGGGGGTGAAGVANGSTGGSGGAGAGAVGLSGTGGSNTSGQGNIGGAGNGANIYPAGGGGGSAAAGGRSTAAAAGSGGNGDLFKITGLSAFYAGGGGGGGATVGTRGAGGSGSGGNGATSNAGVGSVGAPNTGGGGGGGGSTGAGGAGGSGIVVINSPYVASSATGTYTTNVLGTSASYVYTGNGSITYSTTAVSSISAYSTRFKTTDYIVVNRQVNTTLFDPGNTGAWTLECWFYPLATTAGRIVLIGTGTAYGHALQISWGIDTVSKFTFAQANASTGTVWSGVSTDSYALSAWYHLAVCKDSSNTIRCFINGVEDVPLRQTNMTSTIGSSTGFLVNSKHDNTGKGQGCNCFTSNVRWTKGTAIYTSNFTPSLLPLTSYPGASALLLCQSSIQNDNSYNAYPVIVTNTPTISRFAPSNGDILYSTPGTYTWVAPAGVTNVSVVCVGGGGGGGLSTTAGAGGGGGGLGWKNNIAVIPGESYTVVVGTSGSYSFPASATPNDGGDSYFIDLNTVAGKGGKGGRAGSANCSGDTAGGTYVGDGGGNGGTGGCTGASTIGGGGGGAGGYTGPGGFGGSTLSTSGSGSGGGGGGGEARNISSGIGGGGVGVYGQGSDGSGGTNGGVGGSSGTNGSSLGVGGQFGGGGGGYRETGTPTGTYGNGGVGAVRIIWPGNTRTFPTTNVFNYVR
jgi:hypothetical protein